MSLKEAREKALEIHNKYRSRHHDTPPMRLADDLNEQVYGGTTLECIILPLVDTLNVQHLLLVSITLDCNTFI